MTTFRFRMTGLLLPPLHRPQPPRITILKSLMFRPILKLLGMKPVRTTTFKSLMT